MTNPTTPAGRPRRRLRAVWRDERGLASTVQVIVLLPLTATLLFAGVQTVLWQHARTVTADRANQTAALVATGQLTPTEADDLLTATLNNDPDIAGADVTITATATVITVSVNADANGILTGTRTRIHLDTATPTEGWQPLP